jgi:predicted nucleic acid-binding protein
LNRLLLDLNVLLDVVLDRPDGPVAARLWRELELGRGKGYVAAHGITTLFYLVAKTQGRAYALRALEGLVRIFGVAPVDGAVIRRALELAWADFEDAVTAASAQTARCHAIVSRDPKGFRGSPIEVIDPVTAVAWLAAKPE